MTTTPVTAAIQGERGAYHEAAALGYFGEAVDVIPCATFEDIFDKVTTNEVDYGIVAIENSLAGSVHRNYDLLLRYELSIVGEVQIRIAHQLMVLPGVKAEDIEYIYSHPQALAQCEHSITKHFPNAARIATYDTAGSAQMLREENKTNAAALASIRAADIYNMEIIRSDFEDNPENYTRFLILSREPTAPEGAAKTSIVFSFHNMPGALFKCLAVFALRDIDLTKIESRPLQGQRWRYFFYLDFIGSRYEERCQNALNHLQEVTTFFRVLGSYPREV